MRSQAISAKTAPRAIRAGRRPFPPAGRIGLTVGFFQRYPPARAVVESIHYNVQIVRETFQIG